MALALPLLSAASSCLFNKQSGRREERERQSKGERRGEREGLMVGEANGSAVAVI